MTGVPGEYPTLIEGQLCSVRDQNGLLKVRSGLRAEGAIAWEKLELAPTSSWRRGVGYWSAERHEAINTDVALAKYESLKLAVRNDEYGCGRIFTKYRWANKLIRAALVPPGDRVAAKEVDACLRKLWNKGKVRCFLAMLIYKGHLQPGGAFEILSLLAAAKDDFSRYLQVLRRPADYTLPTLIVARTFVGSLVRLLNANQISEKMLGWAEFSSNSAGVALLQQALDSIRQAREPAVPPGELVPPIAVVAPQQAVTRAEEALGLLFQSLDHFPVVFDGVDQHQRLGAGALRAGVQRSFEERGGVTPDPAAITQQRNEALRISESDYQLCLQNLRKRSARILTARLADDKLRKLVALDRALGVDGGKSLIQHIENDGNAEIWSDLAALVDAVESTYFRWPTVRRMTPWEVVSTAILDLP